MPDPTGDWEGEEALDVEWAHAMAPGASIDLVELNPADSDLQTVSAVQDRRGSPRGLGRVDELRIHWRRIHGGEPRMTSIYTTPAGHQGVTFLASAGRSWNAR